ncbi:unnamed protein product [Mucor hiemalis]
MTATEENRSNPFVNAPVEGADTTISAEDMLKLLDSLKLDPSDTELQALVETAKSGQPVERDTLMNIVTNLLADSKHLGELAGSIGDFEIEFK